MKAEFFNTRDQYQIFKDGTLYAEVYYIHFDGECHVFQNAMGSNCLHYIANLDNYSFASDF